jgi:hypothetical protein
MGMIFASLESGFVGDYIPNSWVMLKWGHLPNPEHEDAIINQEVRKKSVDYT